MESRTKVLTDESLRKHIGGFLWRHGEIYSIANVTNYLEQIRLATREVALKKKKKLAQIERERMNVHDKPQYRQDVIARKAAKARKKDLRRI